MDAAGGDVVGQLSAIMVAHRARLGRWLAAAALVIPAAAVVAGLAHYAATGNTAGVRFLALYAAPLFLAAPLWARHRLAGLESRPTPIQAMDAGVLVLSLARFAADSIFPFSGHMLFLTYSGLTVRARWYRILAAVLLAETTVFKLWLWRDVQSWSLGLGLGLTAAAAAALVGRRDGARTGPVPMEQG